MPRKTKTSNGKPAPPATAPGGITRVSIAGFKSIAREQSIEIRPLTILAGANSSGKSSIMQPLLLMKQTMEAPYRAEVFRLEAPNVAFTSADQFLSRKNEDTVATKLSIELAIAGGNWVRTLIRRTDGIHRDSHRNIEVEETICSIAGHQWSIKKGMDHKWIQSVLPPWMGAGAESQVRLVRPEARWVVEQEAFFLQASLTAGSNGSLYRMLFPGAGPWLMTEGLLRLLHVPGLRGKPERVYPRASTGPMLPGTFEYYVASLLAHWEDSGEAKRVEQISTALESLGLTWKVKARFVNDAQLEILVGRLPQAAHGGQDDLVNIADVGFGVSQVLPVVVALQCAESGQLVYLEQPELHLHPRAQVKLAEVLASAARRGVRVVAETHSELLLLGIQTLVAEGKLNPELVKLHWFARVAEGVTTVTSGDLDVAGAYGDWPLDFDDVDLRSQSRYLDAAAQVRS